MFGRIKAQLTQTFFGDLVKDWGVVSTDDRSFYTEDLSLALYDRKGRHNLVLSYHQKSSFNSNRFFFSFPVGDLGGFANGFTKRWHELERVKSNPRMAPTVGPNKLPFVHRLILGVMHGVKLSRLLLDHSDPDDGDLEIRMYGYVTRKGDTKVFIQSDLDASQGRGHVVSGEGMRAVMEVLGDYAKERAD